jgi:hypothetical protein
MKLTQASLDQLGVCQRHAYDNAVLYVLDPSTGITIPVQLALRETSGKERRPKVWQDYFFVTFCSGCSASRWQTITIEP